MNLLGYLVRMFKYDDFYGHHVTVPTRLCNVQPAGGRWISILVPSPDDNDHITMFNSLNEAHNAMARTRRHKNREDDFDHLSVQVIASPPTPVRKTP